MVTMPARTNSYNHENIVLGGEGQCGKGSWRGSGTKEKQITEQAAANQGLTSNTDRMKLCKLGRSS